MCTIVYKLGGSLLDLRRTSASTPRFAEAAVSLFWRRRNEQGRSSGSLVVGGGPIADAVRQWDHVHGLGDNVAHRLALQSMSFNAQLAAAIVGDGRVVTTRAEARDAWAEGRVAVLAAADFVDAEERAVARFFAAELGRHE